MGRAQALAAKIEQLVLAAIDDEEIDRGSLRQIIAGPSRLKDVILLWHGSSWEDYGEHGDSTAFAAISNAEWLDAVDAIEASATATVSPPPPANREAAYREQEERKRRGLGLVHPDPKVAAALDAKTVELRNDIEAALKIVATGNKLGKFPNLVGLMANGLSPSGYADLVAFYHPRGAETLWPIHEREQETDVYSVGALVADGVLMFYPEGDEDSLSSGKGDSKSRLYRFEDMRYWFGDDDEVFFRQKDSLFDVRMGHGHTHEEWGGPSQEDIDKALLAHFGTRPELRFDRSNPPLPDDTGAWQRFVSIFVECRIDHLPIDGFAKKNALSAIPKLLALLPADHPARKGGEIGYAEALLEAGRHADALAVFDKLEPKDRLREWREELDCLYALGHHEELVARVAELEAADADKVDEALPWKAMSLTSLGFPQDAIRLLDAKPANPRDRDGHRCAWARAHALRKSDPAGAEKALWEAFADGSRWLPFGERDFGDASSSVKALLERRRELDMQREVQGDLLSGLEKRVARVEHPYDEELASSAATDQWTLVATVSRPEGADGDLKNLVMAGAEALAGTGEGGIARFDLSDPSNPRHVGDFGASKDYNLDRAVVVGNHLYASGWKAGLKVFDVSDRAKPKLLGTAGNLLDERTDELAAGDGYLAAATDAGVLIYDLADPANPELASIVAAGPKGSSSVNGVAARRFHVFVSSGRGLVVADVRDRRAPRPIAFLGLEGDAQPDGIQLFDDLAVLKLSRGLWLVDVKDPANPKSLGTFPDEIRFYSVARAGTKLLVVGDQLRVVTIDLAQRDKPSVSSAAPFVAAKGETLESDDPHGVLQLDGKLVVATGNRLSVFVREPRGAGAAAAIPDPTPRIQAAEPRLVSWIEEQLKAQRQKDAEFRSGALMLERWDSTLRLTLDAPRSYAGLESGPVLEEPPQFEAELGDLLRRKGETSQITENDAPEDLSRDDQRRYADLSARAWEASLDRVLRVVPGTSGFKDLASGRVHVLSGGVLTRLIATYADPAKPWTPYRRKVPERKIRTLEEKLQVWEDVEKNIARAKSDPEVKSAVLRMAAEGNGIGLRMAVALGQEDEAAVLDAISRALFSGRCPTDPDPMEFLVARKEQPAARAVLEKLFAGEAEKARGPRDANQASERVAAAHALGRGDDDSMVALAKKLLDDPEGDYPEAELAARTIAGMATRAPELLPNLRGWVERNPHDNRLPVIAVQLFRAGEPNPPPSLLEQSEREKDSEQYHSMKTGIKFLDESEWYEDEASKAERLWTGRRLAERVASLKAKNDTTSPVWPAEWTPEPYPASWNYLLRAAWPHLEKAGAVDWYVQRLVSVKPGPEHAHDRSMILVVLNHYAYENDLDKLIPLGEAVLKAPAGTFEFKDGFGQKMDDAKVKRGVQHQLTQARVVKGFQLGRAGKFTEARACANQALAEDPSDGQVLFLDARIAWLENGSPEKGIERAKANIPKVDPHDDAGEGRLLNLIGCAYDEMKRYSDAVIWFEKAAQSHRDPMYLANLAEIYEKLGDLKNAVKYAEQAKRKGARSDLVTRILAEHGGSDEEEDEAEEESEDEEGDLAAEIADDAFADEDTVADEEDE